jgi:hypothetical protein
VTEAPAEQESKLPRLLGMTDHPVALVGEPELAEAIEEFRREHGIASTPEALRLLIKLGLQASRPAVAVAAEGHGIAAPPPSMTERRTGDDWTPRALPLPDPVSRHRPGRWLRAGSIAVTAGTVGLVLLAALVALSTL